MGNHSKLDRFSTNGSTQTEPSAGLKATGFTAGTQPVAKNMNWLLSETIDKVNDVLEDGTISGFDDSVGMAPIIQKYIPAGGDAGWSQAFDGPNLIEHGAALAWVDLCAHVTSAGVREVLALDGNSSCQVTRFDATTGALNGVSGDLSTGNLPAVGTEDWVPECMCSDGTTVYIMFGDQDAAPNQTYYVQAFTIATWAAKSGWPATGCELTGTGPMPNAWNHGGIVVASATQIATANPWVSRASADSECLTVIGMADGVIDQEGAGDIPGGVALDLTSDGTYLYTFTSQNDVCSATISLLNTAIGGNWPFLTALSQLRDILHTGSIIVASWETATGRIATTHTQADGELADFDCGIAEMAQYGGTVAWDGLCLWQRVGIDINGQAKSAVIRMDIGTSTYETSGTIGTIAPAENFIKSVMVLDFAVVDAVYNHLAPIMFDGRDIWLAGDMRDTQTLSGNIYRIPKAVLR